MDAGDATITKGRELLAQRQPAKALAVFDALIQCDPQDIDAHTGRANALLRMSEPQLALASCEEILATHPEHLGVMPIKIMALVALGRVGEARYVLYHHQWNQNESAQLWYLDGELLLLQDRFDAAIESFDMALNGDPDHCEAWMDKGRALLQLKKYGEAVRAFEHVLALQPDNPIARQALSDARAERRQSAILDTLGDLLPLLEFLGALFSH